MLTVTIFTFKTIYVHRNLCNTLKVRTKMKKHNRFNSFLQLYNTVSQQVLTTDMYIPVREVLTVSDLTMKACTVFLSSAETPTE